MNPVARLIASTRDSLSGKPVKAAPAGAAPAPAPAPAPPPVRTELGQVPTGVRDVFAGRARFFGFALAGFAVWSLVFPLDSAVVAPGAVIPGGQNKVLQHRTGGRVLAIHAHEGQQVTKGDPLLSIDSVNDQAELTRLRGKQALFLAMKARLEAEKTPGRVSATPRAGLHGAASGMLDEQQREFEKGRNAVEAEMQSLRERALSLQQKAEGLKKRMPLLTRQVELLTQQYDSAARLVNAGHIARQQAWDIENKLIDRRAELVNVRAEHDAARAGMAEITQQIEQIRNKDARQTSQQLTEVLSELEQISDQIRAAESAIEEKELAAPVTGALVRWAVTTIGAVVKPGDPIGEIVPEGAELEVQARVNPKDISPVRVGQRAKIKVSALSNIHPDPLPGVVTLVSADSSVDQRTQERYFDVRVRLTRGPKGGDPLALVTAGMTAEVFVLGDARTFAGYMLQPLTNSFSKAFGEH